jgi:hypothetical protein
MRAPCIPPTSLFLLTYVSVPYSNCGTAITLHNLSCVSFRDFLHTPTRGLHKCIIYYPYPYPECLIHATSSTIASCITSFVLIVSFPLNSVASSFTILKFYSLHTFL